MRLLLVFAPLFAAVVCASACATDRGYGAVTTSWDAAASNEPTSPKAGEPGGNGASVATAKKVTAKEAAESLRTGSECIQRAKEAYAKEPARGEALLQGCAARDDAVELDAILKGPWTKDLKNSEPFQILIAEVIAHRGGFVEADTKAARAAGVPIYDVNSAMSAGAKAVGKVLVVRGIVSNIASEKWGKGKSDVASVAEWSWADDQGDESGGVIPVRDAPEATGRRVFARLLDKRPSTTDRPVIAAMRIEGPREYTVHGGDNDGDEVKSIIGVAVGFWETGSKLRQ